MTPELKQNITERYLNWTDAWGLSLAFAVTQSAEEAEKIIAEALVSLVATPEDPQAIASLNAIRFATVVWNFADKKAFRGFGSDPFFRMPAVARAIAVLKTKARFSREQIATALGLTLAQVDDHLENARLLFSDGRSWVESPGVIVEGQSWMPDCPYWVAGDIETHFSRYIGGDLDAAQTTRMHRHILVCTSCSLNFGRFKRHYTDWVKAVPVATTEPQLKKDLAQMTAQAFRVRRDMPPPFWPGLQKAVDGLHFKLILFGSATLLVLHFLWRALGPHQ